MATLEWDKDGERLFETGVDRGVFYERNDSGVYNAGHAWNGLTAITESPSGAEVSDNWADNRIYASLVSAEKYSSTLEAYTWPDEFEDYDGSAEIGLGVRIGQQPRKSFGLSYRTLIGNDLVGTDFGYKLHLVYGCLAAPTEKAHNTVNEDPELATFSWEISSSPVTVAGHKPTATIVVDSTKILPAKLTALEALLYGTGSVPAALPSPAAILTLLAAS